MLMQELSLTCLLCRWVHRAVEWGGMQMAAIRWPSCHNYSVRSCICNYYLNFILNPFMVGLWYSPLLLWCGTVSYVVVHWSLLVCNNDITEYRGPCSSWQRATARNVLLSFDKKLQYCSSDSCCINKHSYEPLRNHHRVQWWQIAIGFFELRSM